MRRASQEDVDYIANAMIRIVEQIDSADPYINGLPKQPGDNERTYARAQIESSQSIVLIAERDGVAAGCLVGYIAETSFPPSGVGQVGHVAVVWVEPPHRGEGIARELLSAAERFFADSGVELMELSYFAKNSLAERAWARLGFESFRTFAYRRVHRT